MNPEKIRELLEQVEAHTLTIDEALRRLKHLPYEDIGVATLDNHRALRQGVPEVIFCQNKDPRDIVQIIRSMREKESPVLATRVNKETLPILLHEFPDACVYERAGIITLGEDPQREGVGNVLVVSAGTSDLHVAEEAVVTARFTGSKVIQLYDVGVAGIHRLLSRLEMLRDASVIVVVAGMEGALASVVGGLVEAPVIAVPTSVGYGASFGGLAALLTMLNSCSSGVTVVNIDNGFGAGYAASQINRRICEAARNKPPCA